MTNLKQGRLVTNVTLYFLTLHLVQLMHQVKTRENKTQPKWQVREKLLHCSQSQPNSTPVQSATVNGSSKNRTIRIRLPPALKLVRSMAFCNMLAYGWHGESGEGRGKPARALAVPTSHIESNTPNISINLRSEPSPQAQACMRNQNGREQLDGFCLYKVRPRKMERRWSKATDVGSAKPCTGWHIWTIHLARLSSCLEAAFQLIRAGDLLYLGIQIQIYVCKGVVNTCWRPRRSSNTPQVPKWRVLALSFSLDSWPIILHNRTLSAICLG
jgi:hypothetical protein